MSDCTIYHLVDDFNKFIEIYDRTSQEMCRRPTHSSSMTHKMLPSLLSQSTFRKDEEMIEYTRLCCHWSKNENGNNGSFTKTLIDPFRRMLRRSDTRVLPKAANIVFAFVIMNELSYEFHLFPNFEERLPISKEFEDECVANASKFLKLISAEKPEWLI